MNPFTCKKCKYIRTPIYESPCNRCTRITTIKLKDNWKAE